jgi:hypothetical protein
MTPNPLREATVELRISTKDVIQCGQMKRGTFVSGWSNLAGVKKSFRKFRNATSLGVALIPQGLGQFLPNSPAGANDSGYLIQNSPHVASGINDSSQSALFNPREMGLNIQYSPEIIHYTYRYPLKGLKEAVKYLYFFRPLSCQTHTVLEETYTIGGKLISGQSVNKTDGWHLMRVDLSQVVEDAKNFYFDVKYKVVMWNATLGKGRGLPSDLMPRPLTSSEYKLASSRNPYAVELGDKFGGFLASKGLKAVKDSSLEATTLKVFDTMKNSFVYDVAYGRLREILDKGRGNCIATKSVLCFGDGRDGLCCC